MVINHNILAMNAQRQFNITGNQKKKSTEKLSSGYRINRAGDDAAGLAISEKMRRQIKGLTQASRNMQDGVSLCQVADGWLNEVHDMLQRMNVLAIESSNGTLSDEDRGYIDEENQALKDDIERICDTANFNEIPLFHQPYTPTIIPQPEVSNFAVFHTGNSSAPGGLEINNIRYNIKELQDLGLNIDDTGIAREDIENFEFKMHDGEIVNLDLKKDCSLNQVIRNYAWSAKDDGIYVNDKKAVNWEDLTYNGVAGLSNTSVFQPGKYSFSYNNMESSFSIDDRDASKEKVMFSINGDEITKPVSWNVSAGSYSTRPIAPVSGSIIDPVTAANKNDIDDTYLLSVNEDGIAIYNATDDAYSSRINWDDIPLSSTSEGTKTIADWGKTANSNTEVKFDNDSEFRIHTNYNAVEFDFSFKLSEVSSLEEVINVLDGKEITGNLVNPGQLTSSYVPSGFYVEIGLNASKNITNDLEIQKLYGRPFNATDNSTDTLSGSVSWKKTVTQAETTHEPWYANALPQWPDYTVLSGTTSTETEYIKKKVDKKDENGNTVTDSSGNSVKEYRYYEVEKTVHNEQLAAITNVRYFFTEKYDIEETVTLGTQSKKMTEKRSIDFYRENSYAFNSRRTYDTYALLDSEGKTLEELGKLESEISLVDSNLITPIENHSQNAYHTVYYDDPKTQWTLTSVGEKRIESSSDLPNMYLHTINMPNNAFSITQGLTNRNIIAMENGETKSVSLNFSATGKAQRPLVPVANNTETSELNFDKIRLNVPKKQLDIQAGAESGQYIRMEWSALNLTILGIAGTNMTTQNASQNAIHQIKEAMQNISETRSTFGAYQNRMEHAIRLTDNVVENTTAAESQIRDTDMAKEMVEYSKQNILEQMGTSMITQANQSRQNVLSLLQ